MKTQRFLAASAFGLLVAIVHAQTPTPKLVVTLKPAAPVTGDNALDVLATDASGAPVTGLKLTSTVFMTNMNMGTAHPPVKETGKGHYRVTVGFLMDGPWRVALKGGGVNRSFDFQAGGKQPWKMPADKAAPAQPSTAPAQPTEPPAPTKPEQKRPDEKRSDVKPEEKPTAPDKTTDMSKMPGKGSTGPQTGPGATGMEAMGHGVMKMPELRATGAKTVQGDEDWSTATGFGRNEPMVGMMIQMMVGGSGMEGMKMGAMKMDFGEANFMPGEGGDMKGMPGMDMGSAAGIKATAKLAGSAKTGDNRIEITVVDAAGKPVEKAKITLSVAMTSMDMGTTHPSVKELGKGRYVASVGFSMMGPWRVSAKVEAGGKSSTFPFDFEAK